MKKNKNSGPDIFSKKKTHTNIFLGNPEKSLFRRKSKKWTIL